MFKRLFRRFSRAAAEPPPPRLSVIVACYKMENQIGNTVRSLVTPYQKQIKSKEFEVIVVDNGSPSPLPEETWKLAKNVSYLYIPPGEATPNPGTAINRAVRKARGENLAVILDGARMVSPGTLSWGLRLLGLTARAVVAVRAWHLGPKFQPESILEGYNHEVEKAMLLESKWWENGYRLFEISAASSQTRDGFAGRAIESTCLFLSRRLFDEIGGFNEGYKAPGGGLVNLDFFCRAVDASSNAFTLLGEGTFHQVHGGAATGLGTEDLKEALVRWTEESVALRGELAAAHKNKFILAGHIPRECARWLNYGN